MLYIGPISFMYPIKQVNHSDMKLNELSWWIDESNRNVLLILLIGNLIGISKPRPCLSCYEHFLQENPVTKSKEAKADYQELKTRNWLKGIDFQEFNEGQEYENERLIY